MSRPVLQSLRRGAWALPLVLGVALGGCAFGARQASLRYPPAAEAPAGPVAAAATGAGTRGEIVLGTFADARTDAKRVGSVRNGFGMPTADVVTSDNIPNWLRDALRTELSAAGYQVVERADAAPVLSGRLTQLWCDAYFTYSGEVALDVRLAQGEKVLLERNIEGRGGAGMNWAATAEAYGQTLSLALADALRKLVAQVDGALGRR